MDLFTRFVYEIVEIEIQNLSNLVKKGEFTRFMIGTIF